MNVRTTTTIILNKQVKSVKLFLCNFSTMLYKVAINAMYTGCKKTTTPIILNIPHYIKHR